MKWAKFIVIAALTVSLMSCGVLTNKYSEQTGGQDYETNSSEKSKPAKKTEPETAPVTVYNPYFEVVARETKDGILYLPADDGFGNPTGDIIVIGYNGVSQNVKIPAIIDGGNVTSIGEGAFYGKGNISTITISDSVTEIGRAAFSTCPNLTAVTFGRGITALPPELLRGCKVLSSVKLPETLTLIGDFAFEGCLRLESLYIPASVTEIGFDAFMGCEWLTLDVSDNEHAASYAEENKINADPFFTYSAQRGRIYAVVAAGVLIAAAMLVIPVFLRRKKEGAR